MDVYLMGIVFCPMNKEEQDSDICLRCKHFAGHEINAGTGKRREKPRMYTGCRFNGDDGLIYESSKSKRRITVVVGEPLPPAPNNNEEWRKISG